MKKVEKIYGFRYLGATERVSNDTFVTGQNNHDMIVGPSGSGKTGGYVVPNLQDPYESLLVIDTKSSLCKKFSGTLAEKGFKVRILDFINPEKSTCGYNPLSYIGFDKDGDISQKDIMSLATLVVPRMDERDPYWSQSARKYISMLIAYVMEILPEKDRNMRAVVDIHKECCCGNMEKIFEQTSIECPDTMFSSMYKMVGTLRGSDRTWACVTDFASVALAPFDVKEMDEIFVKKEAFDFKQLGEEKSILFINISDMDRTYDIVLNIIYSQGINSLVELADENEDGRLKVPVRFIMDDFTSGAPIENFDNIISVIRSRDISVSLIIQSLSQLNSRYGNDDAKTILNNCDHILYLGSNDIDTLRYMSSRLNVAEHIVERLPKKKAYLFSSGNGAKMIDKMPPYSTFNDDKSVQNSI